MEPPTIGGKKRTSLPNTGEISIVSKPPAITAPITAGRPRPGLVAITRIGGIALKATPCITGIRTPMRQKPADCRIVAIPQVKRSALIRTATASFGSFSAVAMIIGTAIAPTYITSTC